MMPVSIFLVIKTRMQKTLIVCFASARFILSELIAAVILPTLIAALRIVKPAACRISRTTT